MDKFTTTEKTEAATKLAALQTLGAGAERPLA